MRAIKKFFGFVFKSILNAMVFAIFLAGLSVCVYGYTNFMNGTPIIDWSVETQDVLWIIAFIINLDIFILFMLIVNYDFSAEEAVE